MKIILLILFLSFSSFSVADSVAEMLSDSGAEKLSDEEIILMAKEYMCEELSEDLYDLMMLRQNGESLANVMRKARELNETLDDRVYGFKRTKKPIAKLTWDRYHQTVLLLYVHPVKYSKQLKEEESRMVRDVNFSSCYKELVLAK